MCHGQLSRQRRLTINGSRCCHKYSTIATTTMAHGKSFTKLLLPIVLAIMLATATPFAVPTPKTSNPLVISEESMNLTYEKLAGRLETILGSLSIDEQYWVAIAGGPGSGKNYCRARNHFCVVAKSAPNQLTCSNPFLFARKNNHRRGSGRTIEST